MIECGKSLILDPVNTTDNERENKQCNTMALYMGTSYIGKPKLVSDAPPSCDMITIIVWRHLDRLATAFRSARLGP